MTLNGITVTGSFSGNSASVVEAFQNLPSSGSGYANFPYAYDIGGVLCGGTKQATLHLPITWKYATTRESFGSWIYNSFEGGCNGSNGITYTNFTARCNGGILNPDFKSGQENQCSVTTPPTGLWGFDVQTPCIYPSTPNRSPYFCFHSPLGVIWPRTSLESPAVPFDTPGVCTFNGNTQ